MLSITLEVNVPTRKVYVGGSLLFKRQRCEPPRRVWGHAPPGNFENYRCLEVLFSTFSRQYLGLMNKENSDYINHILCLLQPFFSSKSQSLAFGKEWSDKSSNADSRRVKKRAQQCLPRVLWRGRHFGTCESVGSSRAFHDPSICFNF